MLELPAELSRLEMQQDLLISGRKRLLDNLTNLAQEKEEGFEEVK